MIPRKQYMDKLIAFRHKQLIKIVTGVRRCGKSTLFQLYIDYLKSQGVLDEQIIHVNLEQIELEALLDYRELHRYMAQRIDETRPTYLFIDEVQNCPQFEKAVNSLFLRPNLDIHLIGSNASILSGELATYLSGRYVTIEMLPLSFKEYWEARGAEQAEEVSNPERAFAEYLKHGAFPYIATLAGRTDTITPYLEGIYTTILIKDIATRQAINDLTLLESIIKTVASSIGNPVSLKKISDTLNSSGRKISVNTVESYMRALCGSYILYKADRYDIKGRQYLKTLGKYYLVDTGIRNLLLAQSSADFGHQLENVVYLELLRRGHRVNIGKLGDKEVDFVAAGHDGLSYYQVAASVLDETTLHRELDPLSKIKDNHPKILLTMDRLGAGANYDGIRRFNLVDWLLQE